MTIHHDVLPNVVSRDEWLKARVALLEEEKALTKARDRLNTRRRLLPMVEVVERYEFEGAKGKAMLKDLFEGRRQLIVYHFMWLWKDGEPLERGCPHCSAWTDHIARGHLNHLHVRDTTLALVSRAPFSKIQPFRERMGWRVPWYSSSASRFNFDYHVSFDESTEPLTYNYRTKAEHEAKGTGYYLKGELPFDLPGISCFLRDGDRVYHTYSTYGRGGETVGGAYYFMDLTALGRQEPWEEPKDRSPGKGAPAGSAEIKYPDEYDDAESPRGERRAAAETGRHP
jgi:predicted dithiol-disulfide oxidoreductase (DUF899 family)